MIKKILSVIFNRWVLLALGLLLLFLVIWIVGPLVAVGDWRPLESPGARWLTMLLILLLVGLRMAWQAWRAKRSNEKVVNQLLEAPPAAPGSTEAAEVKVLRERFEAALQTLRNARFASAKGNWWDTASSRLGQRYLYELPWYIIIGAPGSGKTTALLNSGLRFPLADAGADSARGVSGVGGTRNCDWWFTDQAVMIDTAGRYTTQDSDSEADSQAWGGFLGLLKKSRPRQPVNGVLVTVSVTDLLTRSARERLVHANAVRKRVQELHQQLGVRFPIYLLVTKCDLLSGFMDYLGDIDKEQRSTPFGFTFKLDAQHHSDTSVLLQEFDALEKRLTDGLIDRLQLERDVARRARIYGFPQQFGGLRQVLKEYVDSVFSPSQFEAHPMLRGVYFISGTQEGTPIDRMLGVLARTYRIERAVLPPNMATGKSFFLEKLLRDVVFGESELGGTDLKWERRRNVMAIAGYAAVAVLAVLLLVVWGRSYFGNRQYVNEVATRTDSVRQLVQATPNRASPDLLVLLPALRATRDLATGGMGASVPWSLGFGLYQGDRLDAAAERSYERMLVDAVLPRIALRVEEQLRNGGQDLELQYEALKAYVMLHDPERFDAQALRFYVMADWDANLPRQVTTQQRAELDMHLDALLEQGPAVSPLAQDGVLLRQVRAVLAGVPLPQRIYSRLRRLGVAEDIAPFTIAKAAGPSAGLAFMRGSGEPLTSGVTGLYTYEGYHRGFQRDLEATATQLVMEEGWVLGITDGVRLESLRDPAALGRLLDDVRRLYLNDYATIWRRFIADIKLLPTDNLAKTVQMARILSAPDTPLRPLIQGLVRETSLSATDPKSVVERAEDRARGALERSQRQLSRILGNRPQSQVVDGKPIESIVDDQFAGLRQMLKGGDGRPAPIDGTIGLLAEVYTMLVAVDAAVNSGSTPPPSPVNDKARAEAGRLPEPLRSLVDTLATAGLGGALKKTRENLGDQLNAEVGTFCRQALAGRYPLVRGSSTDATPQDFAEIFAPGARMDTFFQRNLAAFVDTSTRPWSFRNLGGASMGDPGTLTQFQRAAEIRDTFFRGSGRAPSLQLQFKPIEMDATITQFTLDVDGQVVRYSHGPQLATTVQWPGQRGASSVRISLLPKVTGGADLTKEGPWSLFRLFDQAQMRPGGSPERFQVTFDVGGRKATFEVTTSSVQNPFALPQLAGFSCPGRL